VARPRGCGPRRGPANFSPHQIIEWPRLVCGSAAKVPRYSESVLPACRKRGFGRCDRAYLERPTSALSKRSRVSCVTESHRAGHCSSDGGDGSSSVGETRLMNRRAAIGRAHQGNHTHALLSNNRSDRDACGQRRSLDKKSGLRLRHPRALDTTCLFAKAIVGPPLQKQSPQPWPEASLNAGPPI